jgi:hypothetical protein
VSNYMELSTPQESLSASPDEVAHLMHVCIQSSCIQSCIGAVASGSSSDMQESLEGTSRDREGRPVTVDPAV